MSTPSSSAHRRFSGRDFTEEELDIIRSWLAEKTLRREQLARRICQEFGWINPQGNLKTMSCKVALLRMHRIGLIDLPPTRANGNNRGKKPQDAELLLLPPTPTTFSLTAEQLRQVRVDVVQTKAERALYHQLLQGHHYLGAGSMAGAQLRYLARSGTEVVGALGFGASAWLVAGRDRFIGWCDASRRAHLHLVVNNNRFLIPPWVQTPNLASHLLSLVSKRIGADWFARYGYSPVLLETFVEKPRFTGTCYRAANWIEVGVTKGRGKLEKRGLTVLPLKNILVYPIQKNFRSILCECPQSGFTEYLQRHLHSKGDCPGCSISLSSATLRLCVSFYSGFQVNGFRPMAPPAVPAAVSRRKSRACNGNPKINRAMRRR